jgi:hypothetical protein
MIPATSLRGFEKSKPPCYCSRPTPQNVGLFAFLGRVFKFFSLEPCREALVKLLSQRLIQNSRRRENLRWPRIVPFETQDDAAFFASERDDNGVHYASRIQTWLELCAGYARQSETAKDLYQTIIKVAEAEPARLKLSTLKFIPA